MIMRSCPCVLAIAVLCVVLQCATPSPMDKHQLELKEHYEHLAYIAEFKCHTPQPRVFAVRHLFTECQTHGKAYFPDVTVLHHCGESTGCCTSGNVCIPTNVQTLHLPFKVTYLEDIDKHKKGSWDIQYFELENHTHCGCEEVHHHEHPIDLSKHPSHPGAEYSQQSIQVRVPNGRPQGSYASSSKETPSVSQPSQSGSLPIYSYENTYEQSDKSSTPDYKFEQEPESGTNSVQKREQSSTTSTSTPQPEPEDNKNATTDKDTPTTRSVEDLFSALF